MEIKIILLIEIQKSILMLVSRLLNHSRDIIFKIMGYFQKVLMEANVELEKQKLKFYLIHIVNQNGKIQLNGNVIRVMMKIIIEYIKQKLKIGNVMLKQQILYKVDLGMLENQRKGKGEMEKNLTKTKPFLKRMFTEKS